MNEMTQSRNLTDTCSIAHKLHFIVFHDVSRTRRERILIKFALTYQRLETFCGGIELFKLRRSYLKKKNSNIVEQVRNPEIICLIHVITKLPKSPSTKMQRRKECTTSNWRFRTISGICSERFGRALRIIRKVVHIHWLWYVRDKCLVCTLTSVRYYAFRSNQMK